MEFMLIEEDRLKITLTYDEASSLPVDFERITLGHSDHKRLLVSLLEQGREETGFSPKDAKLFVEIYPEANGGKVIIFTALKRKAGGRNDLPWLIPYVFAFKSSDDLCDGCAELSRRYGSRIINSALYYLRGKYMLIIYPLDYSDRMTTYLLGEYAMKMGEGEIFAAHIAEHGKKLIEENAIGLMESYFG